MRSYKNSDIFTRMNKNNAITNQFTTSINSISPDTIMNPYLRSTISAMKNAYKYTVVAKAIDEINKGNIIICAFPITLRFPANVPFIKLKRNGKPCVIIDITKYANIERDGDGKILNTTCDISKLYSLLIPAYLSLEVFDENKTLNLEANSLMAYQWATMFNKVLKSQRVFIASEERYEAFMYFAMRFYLSYYCELPVVLIDKITDSFLSDGKSKYIQFVEANLVNKNLNIYKDWVTFTSAMFSNDITNLRALTGGLVLTPEQYIQSFSSLMGRDGAYLALWSVEYFTFCIFATYDKSHILNDRNWDDIVAKDPKIMPKLLSALYKHI